MGYVTTMRMCGVKLKARTSFLLGLFYICLVAIIWAASSMTAQYVYAEHEFNSPFLLTYIGVSLSTLFLPLKYITDRLTTSREVCFEAPIDNTAYELELVSPYQKFASAALPGMEDGSVCKSIAPQTPSQDVKWTNRQHWIAAAQVAPVWFVSNWAFNAALALTSIASSTVLSCTGSAVAFMLAVSAGDEKVGWWNSLGVLLSIVGTALTALHDLDTPDGSDEECLEECRDALYGDLLALVAAVFFGVHVVQIRILCPKNEDLYSMQLLLGYVGLISAMALAPWAIWQLVQTVDLTFMVFTLAVIRGLLDYVLSEYLEVRAIMLTSATIMSVGLGLTIPMGFVADYIMGSTHIASSLSLLGAGAVLASFILVVLENTGQDNGVGEDGLCQTICYELQDDPKSPVYSMA
jgi:solute carrier family 35 protein F5